MCYAKPGPRCSHHAWESLKSTSQKLSEAAADKLSLQRSRSEMDAEEYGQKLSEAQTKLDEAEKKHDEAKEEYWETPSGREDLKKGAINNGVTESEFSAIQEKLDNGSPVGSDDYSFSNGNREGVAYLKKFVNAHYSYEKKKKAYKKSEAQSRFKEAETLIDRNSRPEYISSIETKHITGTDAGSKFTDPKIKTANDVIALAQKQRKNLKGDDREKLIKAGADPKSFLPPSTGVRYLMVKTTGTQAIHNTSELPEDTVLTVRGKGRNDGKPPSLSLSVPVKEQPKTNFATVIVGPKFDKEKEPIEGTNTLWTMHPGVPTRGIRSNDLREQGLDDGDSITVKDLREKFGKDINVNTKLVK